MPRRGRPRKRRSLFRVQNYIEYTSDSNSDTNNVQHVGFEVKHGSLQSLGRHAESGKRHKNDGDDQPQVQQFLAGEAERGEYIYEVEGEPGESIYEGEGEIPINAEPGEYIYEEEGELDNDGEYIHEDEGEEILVNETDVGEYIYEDEYINDSILVSDEQPGVNEHHREVAESVAGESDGEFIYEVEEEAVEEELDNDGEYIHEEDREPHNLPIPVADPVADELLENEDDEQHAGDGEEETYIDLLENLKSQWLLTEVHHCVSKTASEAFWKLCVLQFPKLYNAIGQKKPPLFQSIRRQMYNDLLPKIELQIGYRNKASGEIIVVNDTVTPIKRFPSDKFDKLYEIGTLDVSKFFLRFLP